MKVTQTTRDALAYRRFERDKVAQGWYRVSENGDPLWRLHRGGWAGRRITDCVVAPDGLSIFIRTEPRY
jgi:hypothetical protein